jgi:pimeloyl-ACP methyl ester carboxylesterase
MPNTLPESVIALSARATIHRTPCGEGSMVWRRWGRGVPIVLLHGGSGSWMHWFKTIPALAEAGYAVWAADMPGLGDSAMPSAPFTPENSGRVIASGLRALLPEPQRAHLVGFSFGAHVGTYAAIDLGGRLASFTLTGCAALGLPHNYVDLLKEDDERAATEDDRHRNNLASLMFANPALIDDTAIRIQAANIANARFRSRAFAKTDEIAVNLPRVKAPVRAIWGEKDVLATPSIDARFAILRRGHPELMTRVVANAGHWAMYEQADRFNAGLLALLAAPAEK